MFSQTEPLYNHIYCGKRRAGYSTANIWPHVVCHDMTIRVFDMI